MDLIREIIDIGISADDGTGDPLRTASAKTNRNLEKIWDTIVIPFAEKIGTIDLVRGASIPVQDYSARDQIPAWYLKYGFRVTVVRGYQDMLGKWKPLDFVWTQDRFPGNPEGQRDGWLSLLTQDDLLNRGNHTGGQGQETIFGLPQALAGLNLVDSNLIGAVTYNAKLSITAFKATVALPGEPADLTWGTSGSPPTLFKISWSNWTALVDGTARSFRIQDWTKPTGLTAIGDSMLDNTVPYKLAALIGIPAESVSKPALYSAGSKQIYRVGARPLFITVTGDRIQGYGASTPVVAVGTDIYGPPAPPGPDNRASFLFTYNGDTAVHTIAGTLAGQHVVISGAGGASVYSVTTEAGSPPVDVPPGSIFVPDFAIRMKSDLIHMRLSQNHWYSQVHPHNINPEIWVEIGLIISMMRGNRLILETLTPDATWLPGTPEYTAIRYFRDELKRRWPQYFAIDAAGRDMLDRMIASGDGSAFSNADTANGIVPRNLREDKADGTKDTLHFNDLGETIEAQGLYEFYQRQALPPPAPIGTAINIYGEGTDGLGGPLYAVKVAVVEAGASTAVIGAAAAAVDQAHAALIDAGEALADSHEAQANFEGITRVYLSRADAVAKLPVDTVFDSAETGILRRYQRVAAPPGYTDIGDAYAPLSQASLNTALGRPGWVDANATFHLDYANNRYWQTEPNRQFRGFGAMLDYGNSALTRASLAPIQIGQTISIVPPDTLRRGGGAAQIERASRNLLPNPDWNGAVVGVVGAGGAFPTGYEMNFNTTREILAVGIQDGRRFIRFHLSRTGGAPSSNNVNIRTLNSAKMVTLGPTVVSGQIQVNSLGGVATAVQVNINEFQADGTTSAGSALGTLYTPADGRVDYSVWRNTPANNRITQVFNVACSSLTGDFDAVFTIWSQQVETGEDAKDYTSTMSTADGTNPRVADEARILVSPGNYDVMTRGDNFDTWSYAVASVGEQLLLPTSKRDRRVLEHRGYKSGLVGFDKKQLVSDQRAAIIVPSTGNQIVNGELTFLQAAPQPWAFGRASNKLNFLQYETRTGFYFAGDTAQDRIRSESQSTEKMLYDTDYVRVFNVRVFAPKGVKSESLVLWQDHATEDTTPVPDAAGYPNTEINLGSDGFIRVYTSSVAEASRPTFYDRVLRATIPFPLEVWVRIVYRRRFNFNGQAVLQLFMNGQLVCDLAGVSIGHNDTVGPYFKWGPYWRPHTVDQIIIAQFANMERGGLELLSRVDNPLIAA